MKRRAFVVQLVSILLCLAVVGGVVTLTRLEVSGLVSNPLLYFLDRAWPKEDRQPIERINQVYYVPVSIFAQLDDTEVYVNEGLKTFMIKHGDYWMSFDIVSDFANMMNPEAEGSDKYIRMYMKTYECHGERYVPVQAICSYLNYTCEMLTSPVTGEVAIRVTDGSEEKTFEELLRQKYPGFFTAVTTETTTVKTPVTTNPPPVTSTPSVDTGTDTTASQLPHRTIYLTIEDSPGTYTRDILDVLDAYGYKATFFVIGSQAAENIDLLTEIAARGHTIGLHTMEHDGALLTDGDAILADIEEENELLYRVLKQKSHIWRAPEGSSRLPSLTGEVMMKLANKGYLIWDSNVDVSVTQTAKQAANAAIDGIWKYETPILRFRESANTADILSAVLAFISENSHVCDVRTISPAYYEYNTVNTK
ncbi:MAG: polysaccharide deacetylase family protein [Clostridia bacterium]|nr:polysaccharide deacetylase family protein [Clostridia bacterium]